MAHESVMPSTACAAIATALSVLQRANGGVGAGGTGCVATIGRYAGESITPAAVDRLLVKGLPAMLVAHLGGRGDSAQSTGRTHYLTDTFAIICCAGRYDGITPRLDGSTGTLHPSTIASPGLEDLCWWATYYGLRGLYAAGLRQLVLRAAPRLIRFEPERYIASVEIEATRVVDIHDDATTDLLETLGLVHDPVDYDALFAADDELTPAVDESLIPLDEHPGTGGGVAELEEPT